MENSRDIDKHHIWHPYSAMHSELPVFNVQSAEGVRLTLEDGRTLIDGMASWWCVIHGYNHPVLNDAIKAQLDNMAHVMFGGLTHKPAIKLAKKLVDVSPAGLDCVFFSDSGSVAIEVAMKMALQYWQAKSKPGKNRFIALRHGYHGDTTGAMSISDPENGMHSLFKNTIQQQIFIEQPRSRFGESCSAHDKQQLENTIATHADTAAALVLEPVVQGAGGMWFYSAEYLAFAAELCKQHDILLIADEIATGFGRTGKLFACEHAQVTPDIMCVGKALTGGYMTLAATLTTSDVAATIDMGEPGVFMHGPTFMANPLACAVANSSIELLLESDWQDNIRRIENILETHLSTCNQLNYVADVRVLGAIGVIELHESVDMKSITTAFVDAGIWVRPFGKLVYLMPPYSINNDDLVFLCERLLEVLENQNV